jgi:hypothetical protein
MRKGLASEERVEQPLLNVYQDVAGDEIADGSPYALDNLNAAHEEITGGSIDP